MKSFPNKDLIQLLFFTPEPLNIGKSKAEDKPFHVVILVECQENSRDSSICCAVWFAHLWCLQCWQPDCSSRYQAGQEDTTLSTDSLESSLQSCLPFVSTVPSTHQLIVGRACLFLMLRMLPSRRLCFLGGTFCLLVCF